MRVLSRAFVAVLLTAVAFGFPTVASAQAPSQSVRTIAGIMAKMNHFPNDAEKTTLQGIVDSTTATAGEKVLAAALRNVQHSATADDKVKLGALSKDQTASGEVRMLAGILAGITHTATEAEKAMLAKVAAAK